MAKNTGRGSRSGAIVGRHVPSSGDDWTDTHRLPWVVWAEPDGVAIYEGERDPARTRRLLTTQEARDLAAVLLDAAATAAADQLPPP